MGDLALLPEVAADLVTRRMEHDIERLRRVLIKISENAIAPKPNRKQTVALAERGQHLLAVMLGDIQTPELDLWRNEQARREKARAENQHIVVLKLQRTKQLLREVGWTSEALESELKEAANSFPRSVAR